jgi:capsular polysaccharide biosynthesis protein
MDIWRVLSAIIRRWYIIIPLLVVTGAAAATIGHWVKPEYKTQAIINVVLGNATVQNVQAKTGQLQLRNPYLSVDYAASILEYSLKASSTQQDLAAAGLVGAYEVKAVPRSSFVGIDVTANDPDLAMATAHGIIDRARRILAKRQSAIDPGTPRVLIEVLDNADAVTASTKGQLQAQAGVLAVGGIVSVIVTVLANDLLLLRRRRREREADVEATTDVEIAPSSNGTVSAADQAVATGTRVDR